jgi:hypothetical protein
VADDVGPKIALSEISNLQQLINQAPARSATEVSKRQAIAMLAPNIFELRAKGYAWRDVAAWLTDLETFAECAVLRAKTRTIRPAQRLTIPAILRPFLRAWWDRAGRPGSGPVFPVRSGKRLGSFRNSAGGLAERLRHGLFRARVWRTSPIEVPATSPGKRTDLGRRAEGTKLAPNPRDPLYYETATTLPVDFHSFRRAFNTALAEAGVNVQHAMLLASHSDARTHMRYVMKTAAMRTIPEAAIPRLPVGVLMEVSRAKPPASADDLTSELASQELRIVTAHVALTPPQALDAQIPINPVGAAGFEPATSSV